jgi:enterochelin esterase-like enzyme
MNVYLERAQKEGTPLIDGEKVTYVWWGTPIPALIDDVDNWESNPVELAQVDHDTWIHEQQLPLNTYLEYAYLDLERGERTQDPFNRRRTPNGYGDYNHYFYMPKAAPNKLTRRSPNTPRGDVTRHTIPTLRLAAGRERRVDLYQPPTNHPAPLIVVYDGDDFLSRGHLTTIVDNLISEERIQPVCLAMVANGKEARELEYGCNEITIGFLTECVLPLAYDNLNLLDIDQHPGAFGIIGASMGGLMAFFTGLRLPQIFGHVLSQSGAFSIDIHEFIIFDLVRHMPMPELNLWLDVGTFEWLLETNRDMHNLLAVQGMPHGYFEFPGGHNFTSWRNHIWRGLEYLFGSAQSNKCHPTAGHQNAFGS